ncbi:Uncharacterized protein APZ42_002332, partial [Daphnia magna]
QRNCSANVERLPRCPVCMDSSMGRNGPANYQTYEFGKRESRYSKNGFVSCDL